MSNNTPYPIETLKNYEDDGTMPENVADLSREVVGHRIVKVEKRSDLSSPYWESKDRSGLVITLDNGKTVTLTETSDCCAFTEAEAFLLHADRIDHAILGVGTTGEYTKWHIYADLGDVLEIDVNWSGGNIPYYGYGFDIAVIER